jgi:NAD(P)-dependent dehydrogenase (short-subunit alcohol dehydrogenase family)
MDAGPSPSEPTMSRPLRQLESRRCLLVGGTGGLGQAAARRFLEHGATLALAGHDPDAGRLVAAELSALGPCSFFPCDATQPEQVERLFAEAVASLGGLDVLYHLAGASGRRQGDGALHECSDAGWQATLAVNLTSVFLTNRAALRHFLAARQPGVILNLASVLALAPSPRHFDTCAYAAAKGAIISMSRQAAARYAPDGIRVNVLAPGLIDTPMARRAVSDPAIGAYLKTRQPLRGGPGQPDDCADAAVLLCGEGGRFLTGVVLPVDGGWCVSEGT